MTTFEHALVGVTGTLATGLHRRAGWRVPVVAGVAGASPDWDGLLIVFGAEAFATGHRVWGHNLLIASVVALMIAELDFRFDLAGRVVQWMSRFWGSLTTIASQSRMGHRCIWLIAALGPALVHLPCDMVVSGTAALDDWPVPLLWPFSADGFVYPMIPWGDPGVTIVFVGGMFAMAKRPTHIQPIACTTLATVITYLLVRRFVF